jgi:hypothetical protein
MYCGAAVMVGAADMVVMAGAAMVVKVGAAAIVVTAGAKACGAATTWGAATVVVPKNPLPPRFMVDMIGAAAIVVGILAKADISTRVLLRIDVWQNR